MIKVNIKHRLRKLSIGLVSVGTMFMATTVSGAEITSTSPTPTESREPQPTTPTGNTEQVENEETAVSSVTSGSADNGQEQAGEVASAVPVALTSATPAAPVVEEPKTIEVEKLQVEKEKSTLEVKDGEGTAKLIKHRDDKSREIFDVSRDVKVNNDDTLDVTLTVQPKQIDEGAEVMVLLDVSKKMTEDSFKTAKENIKKLVDTLTSKASDGKSPNARNTVRLITFYNKVNEPVYLTPETVNTEIDKARVFAKEDRNWGVDLQGAIHRARQAFNSTGEKKSGKRQHIVLFSQGESTFSYDIKKDKEKLSKIQVDGPVTYSNPLLPWPFYFDTTTKTHNFVKDADKFTQFLDKVGISQFKNAVKGMASTGNSLFSLGNRWLGIKNPLDYITLADLDTKELKESEFDYSNRLGEGYNFRSYYNRVTDTVGLKSTIESEVKKNLKKLESKEASSWLTTLGLKSTSDSVRDWLLGKALDYLFYRRQYQFYNHNLSAQAEAKIARDEGILFYSFDVTKPGTTFDKYLQEMSEDKKFLEEKDLTTPDKFKDVLTQVTITDTFGENVSVVDGSFDKTRFKTGVKHTPAKSNSSSRSSGWGWPFGIISSILGTNTKESLTWTINKDELAKAFEERKPVTFTYKLKVNKDKFSKSTGVATNKEATYQTIISNTTSYKINDKEVKDKKLEDVKVRYTKETIPVPKVEKENVGPQTPQEQPMQPLSPAVPAPEVPKTETEPIVPHLPEKPQEEPQQPQPEAPVVPAPEAPKTETEPRNPQRPERPQEGIQPRRPEVPSDPRPEVPKTETEPRNPQRPEIPQEDSQPRRPEVPSDPRPEVPKTETESHKPQRPEMPQEDSQPRRPEVPVVPTPEAPKTESESHKPQLSETLQEDSQRSLHSEVPSVSSPETPKDGTIKQDASLLPISKAKAVRQLPQTGDKDRPDVTYTVAALTVLGAIGLLKKKRRDDQID
ncbi:serum opacification factor [Streptococcus ruminantium]|uniref:serum opacification factor n=1 Tax=Streptococcus ruminantium TaxID=1917441 RepID=UPI0012DDA0D6|nr:serum opacification factor [Streptococcus ruminantium]